MGLDDPQNGARRDQAHTGHGDGHAPFEDDIARFLDALFSGQGREFIEAVRDHATDFAHRRKGDAARSVEDIARSMRASGHAFDDRPHIRDFVDAAALGLENLADDIRTRSFRQIYGEVEDFARKRPLLVATAAGLAGFLVARWLARPRHFESEHDLADTCDWSERDDRR